MPDARAKRRRQRRQEQLEAADLEKVSGFAVKTHMVTGAAIGGVAALVLANVLWPEKSYVLTPQETAMTLGGGALGAFIMGCRKILGNLEADAPTEARRELRRARLQGIAGGVVAGIALGRSGHPSRRPPHADHSGPGCHQRLSLHRLRGMARGHFDRGADPAPGPK